MVLKPAAESRFSVDCVLAAQPAAFGATLIVLTQLWRIDENSQRANHFEPHVLFWTRARGVRWHVGAWRIYVSLLALTFFIAKTQQQRFKLIKRLLLIGPDRLDDDTVAAIKIGGKHSQYAGGREILLAFANRNCALEPDHAPNELRRRSRVQPELVDNFEFFTHGVQSSVPVALF